jgi:hypothetical protein
MKLAKVFCLAAIAAIAAAAFIGASSASALSTQLCNELSAGAGCAAPTTSVHLVSTEAVKLLNSTLEIQCEVLFASTSLGALGTPSQSIIGHFTYTGCKTAVGNCSMLEVSSEAKLSVEKIGAELAKVTGQWEVLILCSGFIHCVYNGTGLLAEAKGSDPTSATAGHITSREQTVNKVKGSLCPATTKLDLLLATLSPIYIRE